MMGAIEGSGQSVMHIHGRVHDRDGFPGRGRHLGHMRGTAEGPPGLRPDRAETRDFVGGAKSADAGGDVQSRAPADLGSLFDRFDGDADGQLSRSEFYDFSELVIREGLEALLSGIGGGGDGGDDDAIDDAMTPPPVDEADASDGESGTGGVAATPMGDGGTGGVAATPVGDGGTGGVAARPAPEIVESGNPVFDLTLSSVAANIAEASGFETALTLLQATQGYSEAAGTA